MKLIQEAPVNGKRVFLRADFNVPMKDGVITDNNRIKSVIPTIKYLVGEKAKIIIGTHCGRPEGKRSEETSINPIAKELQRLLNLKVAMAPDVTGEEVKKLADSLQPGGILVLENLRWDKREEENDSVFAQKLAELADIYINDAFAVSHRANASVEAITHFLPSYAGLLLEKEIDNLSELNSPSRPFVVIIGGVKIDDKAGVINALEPKTSEILLGGGVANTFLKANGEEISDSVCDAKMIDECKDMLQKYNQKLVLPIDYIKDNEGEKFHIYDIGPKTIELYSEKIKNARTIFWNGNLGYTEESKYSVGSRKVAEAVADSNAKTVIAGGDTAGFIINEGLESKMTFVSTGGGAALEFLAGKKLPGLEALE